MCTNFPAYAVDNVCCLLTSDTIYVLIYQLLQKPLETKYITQKKVLTQILWSHPSQEKHLQSVNNLNFSRVLMRYSLDPFSKRGSKFKCF